MSELSTYRRDVLLVGARTWRVERHDAEDGSISYDIMEHGPGEYRFVAQVTDEYNTGRAKEDATLMAAAPALYDAIIKSDDAHWTPAMRAAMRMARGEPY